jgi:hypothetical protein
MPPEDHIETDAEDILVAIIPIVYSDKWNPYIFFIWSKYRAIFVVRIVTNYIFLKTVLLYKDELCA